MDWVGVGWMDLMVVLGLMHGPVAWVLILMFRCVDVYVVPIVLMLLMLTLSL